MVFPMATEARDGESPSIRFKDKSGVDHPYIIADSPLAKRLSGLSQIMHDLNHAHELAAMVKSVNSDDVAYSLWMSAIVTYGKCFATAKGRKSKLEESHVKSIGEEEVEFHRSILAMRNEYFAHAGVNEYEKATTLVILNPESQEKGVAAVNHFNVKHTKPSEDFCIYFCHLCRELFDVVESIGDGVHQRVLEEYRSMDIEELYRKIKT